MNGKKESPYDYWTVNGDINLGLFRGGTLDDYPNDVPIRLQRGNAEWGGIHIQRRHGHWLIKSKLTLPEMVWTKCQHVGSIYNTENADKYKINLVLQPAALMVLRYIDDREPYFRVITTYLHTDRLDGKIVGRYVGVKWEGDAPVFALQEPKPIASPVVTVKRKRTYTIPVDTVDAEGKDRS